MTEKYYRFDEPHNTGGNATIRISRAKIIDYMRKDSRCDAMSDDEVVDQFCVVNWAWEEND